MSVLRSAANLLFPPLCPSCGEETADATGLCAACWGGIELLSGTVCDGCARPLPVIASGPARCDDCADARFEWGRVRAAALYGGAARNLVLSLKHAGRPDLAPMMAEWMARAGADILAQADLVVPVPLHWTRRAARRINQAAELSRAIAARSGTDHGPAILRRLRADSMTRGKGVGARASQMQHAFGVYAGRGASLSGARIALIDDVMTSGATAAAAARVLKANGAKNVDILVFARVLPDLHPDEIAV